MADEVLRERRGHVEILTINRPEARNAINRATAIALGDALDACESDDDVWVVVLTGAGDKAFSAGMDLKAFAAGEFPITDKGFGGITQRDFPKPLIAAANGMNYTMALDSASLQHYDAEALAAAMAGQNGIPAWDPSEFWLAADGLTQVAMPSAAAALAAAVTIRGYYKGLIKNAATLGAQIAGATTLAAVEAVNVAAGWPSNA